MKWEFQLLRGLKLVAIGKTEKSCEYTIPSSKQEKTILPPRLLSCLVAFSMLLLISSSLSILHYNKSPFIPKSLLQFISIENNTSITPDYTPQNPVQIPVQTPLFIDQTSSKQEQNITIHNNNDKNTPKTEESPAQQCDKTRALLKIYMYDLPPEFHFGLVGWNANGSNQTWPNITDVTKIPSYPGGLNLQHSTEYWLTLDLLASENKNVVRACNAIRVHDWRESNLVFVPFFSSLSYNRHSKRHDKQNGGGVDRSLQEKLVRFLEGRKEWKKFGGKDHLIVAHHPNSLLVARKKLSKGVFVLSDFARYPRKIANLDKDVVAPYKHMVRTVRPADSPSFEQRPTLVYFQGAIYRKDGGIVRQELYRLIKNEKDVHFTFGSAQGNGIKDAGKGMSSSKFCLDLAGDTPSSNRLFDAIASHCVPVIISDEIELPFEDVLDYSEFCVFVKASDAVKKGYLLSILREIEREKWTKMWERLKSISRHYEYQFPSQPNDSVDMIWQTVAHKKAKKTMLNVHRKNRYSRWRFQ